MSKRAGAVSAETRDCILQAARDEFARCSFQGASLRRICSAAGVTTGALYFFFDGKDDLFKTVLSEITGPMMDFITAHYQAERAFLDKTPDVSEQNDMDVVAALIDFYFQKRRTWTILLGHRNHPAVQDFMDAFTGCSEDHYQYIVQLARQAGRCRHPVERFAIRQFVQMQTEAILTLISQELSRDEMLVQSKTVIKMLRGAFYALLAD